MIKWLYEHPQGTDMRDGPNGETAYEVIKNDCKIFTEVRVTPSESFKGGASYQVAV